jgi:hypothetical protein
MTPPATHAAREPVRKRAARFMGRATKKMSAHSQ